MHCVIYKGLKKPDGYLFVEKEDDFSRVPDNLLTMFGSLEYVMTLELREKLKLVQANTKEVMQKLKEQGYYLQLPVKDYIKGQVPPPSF